MGAGRQVPRGVRGHSMRVLLGGAHSTAHAAGTGGGKPPAQALGPLYGQAQQAGEVHGRPRAGRRRRGRGMGGREPGRLRRPRRCGLVASIRLARPPLGVPCDAVGAAARPGGTSHVCPVRAGRGRAEIHHRRSVPHGGAARGTASSGA
eukprot:6209851-Pleurochrysis_carterae.AAC.1